MRRKILLLFFITLTFKSFSQWSFKTVKSDFDGTYKRAIVVGSGGEYPYKNPYLVVRYGKENGLDIYISDAGYSGCDNRQVFFKFNGDDEKYKSKYVNEGANSDSWFISSLENFTLFELIEKFKKHSYVSVRLINDCSLKDYRFSLNGSTKAIDYVISNTEVDSKIKELRILQEREKEEEINKKIKLNKFIKFLEIEKLTSSSFKKAKNEIKEHLDYGTFEIDSIVVLPDDSFSDYYSFLNNNYVKLYYIKTDKSKSEIYGNWTVEKDAPVFDRFIKQTKKIEETKRQNKARNDKIYDKYVKETERIKKIVSKYNFKPLEDFLVTSALFHSNNDTSNIKDISIIITDYKNGKYQFLDLILHQTDNERYVKIEYIPNLNITKNVLKSIGGKKSIEF